MKYVVTLVLGIELIQDPNRAAGDVEGEILAHVDDAMRELERRWIDESGVELDLARSEALFSVVVNAGDETRAISQARGALSIAVHAARGATPHRPFPPDAEWSVKLLAAWATPQGKDGQATAPGAQGADRRRPTGTGGASGERRARRVPQTKG